MGGPFIGLAKRIQFEPDIGQAEQPPKPRQHDNELGIDVGPGKAKRLDIDLMKLAIASTLRALVAKYRAHRLHTPRALIQNVVFDRCSYQAGGEFRADRKSVV